MKKDTTRQLLVFLAVAATIAVNALANILPFNGVNTGEISDQFKVFFVPAGYVFSIWGLIYIGLVGYAVYQALPRQRENPRLRATGYLFVLSSLLNIAWLFLWHYGYFKLTLAAMLGLLVLLVMIYLRLRVEDGQPLSFAERLFVRLTFSIYLGWITVATIANVTDVLYFVQWGGWGVQPQVWAVLLLGAGVIIAALMAFIRRDLAYLAVLVWAFAGIGVKQAAYPLVAVSAWVATAAVGLLMIAVLLRRPRQKVS